MTRKSINTVLFNGERRLASRKTGQFFNWINQKAASRNAKKISDLLNIEVEVKNYTCKGLTVYYLVTNNYIA